MYKADIGEFVKASAVSSLVNGALCHLYDVQPVSPRDVFCEFTAHMQRNEEKYYLAAREQFDRTLDFIMSHGFVDPKVYYLNNPSEAKVANAVLPLGLRFAIPLDDGRVFELFPGGACVDLTPNNLMNFEALLRAVRDACGALYDAESKGGGKCFIAGLVHSTGVSQVDRHTLQLAPVSRLAKFIANPHITNALYVPRALVFLPLAPACCLLSSSASRGGRPRNYRVMLDLMRLMVLTPGSPWSLRNSINLVRSPDHAGPETAGGVESGPNFYFPPDLWNYFGVTYTVPFNERLLTTGTPDQTGKVAVSGSGRMVELVDVAAYIRDATATLDTLLGRIQPKQVAADSDWGMAVVESGNVDAPLAIHGRTVAAAAAAPAPAPAPAPVAASPVASLLDMLQFPVGSEEREFWAALDFLRNQPVESFPATKMSFLLKLPYGEIQLKENGEFVAVTPANLDQFVEAIFDQRHEIHDMYARGSGSGGSGGGSAMQPTNGGRTPAAHHPRPPTDSTGSSPNVGGGRPTGRVGLDSLQRYPVADSASWNKFVLELDDLENAHVNFVDNIFMLENAFCDHAITDEQLAEEKFYIPSKRGPYELIPNGKQIPVNKASAAEYFTRIRGELDKIAPPILSGDESPQPRQHNPAPPQSSSHPPAPRQSSSLHNQNISATPATATAALDNYDISHVRLMRSCVEMLVNQGSKPEDIIAAELDFDLFFPSKSAHVLLIEHGDRIAVSPSNFNQFTNMALTKLRQIEDSILQTGRYVIGPPTGAAAAPSPAAIEGARGLFSPTNASGSVLRR